MLTFLLLLLLLLQANDVADHLYKRLSDGNSKVQATAVEALLQVLPALGSALENAMPQIVPPLSVMLSSGNSRINQQAMKVGWV